jgi:transcriptional regulator with XRE-family HTH domain
MNTRNLLQNERLIHFRLKAGLNQSELAREARLTPAAISMLEGNPNRDPTLYAAKAIAKALGVSIDALAGNESENVQLAKLAQENGRLKRKLDKIKKEVG